MAFKPLLTINIRALFYRISNSFNQLEMATYGCTLSLMARMKSLMEALPIGESIAFDTTCRRQEQSLANHFQH